MRLEGEEAHWQRCGLRHVSVMAFEGVHEEVYFPPRLTGRDRHYSSGIGSGRQSASADMFYCFYSGDGKSKLAAGASWDGGNRGCRGSWADAVACYSVTGVGQNTCTDQHAQIHE